MWRKVAKVGAVKTERNRSRSERTVGVSCTCGLLVARGPGRGATSRIIPRRKEVAIPLAYPAPEKVRNRNKEVYSVERPRPKRPGPGRPPKPERILPADLCYATVRKARAKGRVVEVVRTLVF